MSPRDFTRLMGRFFDTATIILVDEGAMVDKFVGDEVIGLFVPAMATEAHAEHASRGPPTPGRTGHDRRRGPWLPIGIGVNTGRLRRIGRAGDGLGDDGDGRRRQHDGPAQLGRGGRRDPRAGRGRR